MKESKNDFGIFFWLHLIALIIWYASPFLFSWYFVLAIFLLLWLQEFLIKGCILTHAQFGKDTDQTFWGYYLEKLGLKISRKVLRLVFYWTEPILILVVSIIWQLILGHSPFLF